jgi:DNA-directed RNA polymerase subunit RPC12/RpoP
MSIVLDTPFELAVNDDNSFAPSEVGRVLENYVCSVCHAELVEIQPPGSWRRLIACVEHGNICDIGRVTRSTVSIEMERAYKSFHEVIRNLSDLWGSFAEEGFPRDKAHIIYKDYVCAVCGGDLYMYSRRDDPKMNIVDIKCQTHGNINLCGYTPKDKFRYDFQRIRVWEKEHRR